MLYCQACVRYCIFVAAQRDIRAYVGVRSAPSRLPLLSPAHLDETLNLGVWAVHGARCAAAAVGREVFAKGRARFPFLGGVGGGFFHLNIKSASLLRFVEGAGVYSYHVVDLFQCQALGLWNEDPGEQGAEETGAAPDKEHFDAKAIFAVDDEGSYYANDAVPEPIGCGTKSDGFAADRELKYLSYHNPGGRSL